MVQQQQQAPGARTGPAPVPEQVKRLEAMLTGMTRDFEAALPAAAKARVGDFLRLALIDVPRSKGLLELAEKNPARIMIALMDIARLGLVPGSKLGEAWVVPFAVGKGQDRRPDCSAIVGYQGFLKLARNSGLIESICARAVFEGDTFEVRFGLHEDIVHVPAAGVDRTDPNKVIGCYSVAKFRGGGHHVEFMSDAEIIAISKRSPSYNKFENAWSGPWATDWIEMAKKTVIRRAAKQWPKSIEMAEAIGLDERSEIVVEAESAVSRPALGQAKSYVYDLSAFGDPEPEPVAQSAPPPAEAAKAVEPSDSKPAAAPRPRKQTAAPTAPPAPPAAPEQAPGEPRALTSQEKLEIMRREREEAEREAAARDRARGD